MICLLKVIAKKQASKLHTLKLKINEFKSTPIKSAHSFARQVSATSELKFMFCEVTDIVGVLSDIGGLILESQLYHFR